MKLEYSRSPLSDTSAPRAVWMTSMVALAWLIILAGIGLRLRPYQANRSLWRDESSLSYNLVNPDLSFHDLLFQPLKFNQAAPVGFLTVERLAVMTLGPSERALRLFPLIAGIMSLPLFYFVARRIVGVRGTLIGLTLFALSEYLIYYSSEVKQFGIDVGWTLAILLCALRYAQDGRRAVDAVLLGVVGFVAIWFSHPAIFVLAGVGVTLFFDALRAGYKDRAIGLATAGAAWVIAFGVNWFFFLRMVSGHEYLKYYWHKKVSAFPPLPASMKALSWYVDTFFEMWANPIGLPAAGLAAAACVIGAVWLWRNDRKLLGLLGLPVAFTVIAALLQQYPFQDRMLLFLAPILLLLIAGGVAAMWNGIGERRVPVGLIVFILLLIQPLYGATAKFLRPPMREEFRPVIAQVAPKVEAGDTLYLYEGAVRAFHCYTTANPKQYGLPAGVDVVEGPTEGQPWSVYQQSLDSLTGKKRVWIMFSHIYKWSGVDERLMYLHMLNQMGRQVAKFESYEASAYLYDLSAPPTTQAGVP